MRDKKLYGAMSLGECLGCGFQRMIFNDNNLCFECDPETLGEKAAKESLEKAFKKSKKWRPKMGETYFTPELNFGIFYIENYEFSGTAEDKTIIKAKMCFKTYNLCVDYMNKKSFLNKGKQWGKR